MDGWHGARRWGALAVGPAWAFWSWRWSGWPDPPGSQLEVLRQLGEVGADPLASLLALLASVPGTVGRLAAGATVLATPAAVRRALDLLLGGALLAPATLTRPPRPSGRRAPPHATAAPGRWPPPRGRCPPGRAGRQPVRRGRGQAPLPPWLAVVGPDLLVPPYRPDRR